MSSNLTQVQLLLDRAEIIIEKHRQENLGNKFNIFSILRSESDEVNLHSRFIYELLNPKGAHNQDTIFLKLFLNELIKAENNDLNKADSDNYADVELQNVVVKREFRSESGRYDLLIRIKNEYYVIENKIYQPEGLAQLLKYYEGILGEGKQGFKIVLLTLLDHELSNEEVKEKLADHFIPITYKENITSWLKECIKEAAQYPLIRETLVMYKNLVRKLTGHSYSERMVQEMKELILDNRKNLENALAIEETLVEAKIELQVLFWDELEKQLEAKLKEISEKHLEIIPDNKWTREKVKSHHKDLRSWERHYGLSIPIEKDDHLDCMLVFEVKIHHHIYYRFVLYEKQSKVNEGNIVRSTDSPEDLLKLRETYGNIILKISDYKDSSYTFWRPSREGEFWFKSFNINSKDILEIVEEDSRILVIENMVKEVISDIEVFNNLRKKHST